MRSLVLVAAFALGAVSAENPKQHQDAGPDHGQGRPPTPLPAKVIHQFPSAVWIENLAVRKTGDILLTQLRPEAAVLSLSHLRSRKPRVEPVHKFPSLSSLLGIAEPSTDVFVVVGTKFAGPGSPINGTAETWLVDYRSHDHGRGPSVKPIGKHQHMVFPNGMVALPRVHDHVLVSDSTLGLVWRVSIQSGEATVAVKVPEMAPIPGSTSPIGINGIKVFDGHLYWANSGAGKLYRIRIDQVGNPAYGARVEPVYRQPGPKPFIDDFTHDERGIWGATNQDGTVFHVAKNGQPSTVSVPDASILARDTSCAFGRTRRDGKTLYVATGNVEAGNGQEARGGRVLVIDTASVY